jgi:hypothetical protein
MDLFLLLTVIVASCSTALIVCLIFWFFFMRRVQMIERILQNIHSMRLQGNEALLERLTRNAEELKSINRLFEFRNKKPEVVNQKSKLLNS